MKKSRIRFLCGMLFFIFWFIFENAKAISVRKFLGIDVSESIYFSPAYPIGLISIVLFIVFSLLNNSKKYQHEFSVKNEIKILTIYLLIFLLPVIFLGKQCTVITEKNIIKYNFCGEIQNRYSLTDIDGVRCELYNVRDTAQFDYILTVENSSVTVSGTDNENDWKAMIYIDNIAQINNIPKTVDASVSVEDIKNYSALDKALNSSTGVYTYVEYIEELIKTPEE